MQKGSLLLLCMQVLTAPFDSYPVYHYEVITLTLNLQYPQILYQICIFKTKSFGMLKFNKDFTLSNLCKTGFIPLPYSHDLFVRHVSLTGWHILLLIMLDF